MYTCMLQSKDSVSFSPNVCLYADDTTVSRAYFSFFINGTAKATILIESSNKKLLKFV